MVPNRHVTSLLDLDPDLMSSIYEESQRLAKAMVSVLGAVGLNVFQNSGIKAGQSVSHYHVHVVPRYGHSEPGRVFKAVDHPHTPVEQLAEIANELRIVLRP